MKKIVVVAFEVENENFDVEGLTNSDILYLYVSGTWNITDHLTREYDILSVHDTKVEEKADADETGTTTGTPELDEGPTG